MTQEEIAILGTHGHVAIPRTLRKGLKDGDVFRVERHEDKLILERVNAADERLREELEFGRRTREAWKRYRKGEFKKLPFDAFVAQMAKW